MAKVTAILRTIKTGGPVNKPWTLVEVDADGTKATGFMPITVGDEVELTKNEQYNNYSFKRLGHMDAPSGGGDDVSKMLNEIYKKVVAIEAHLGIEEDVASRIPFDE